MKNCTPDVSTKVVQVQDALRAPVAAALGVFMPITKQTIISSEIQTDTNNIGGISDILIKSKFKNISHNAGLICAQRGSHFATLVIPGEPRRLCHKIEITPNNIRYIIDTWFGIFTPADSNIFTEEAKIISSLINGTEPDYTRLNKYNRIRLLTDIGVFIVLVGFGFFIGYLLVL